MEATLTARAQRGRPPDEGTAAMLVLVLQCERPLGGSLCLPLAGLDEVVLGRGGERRVERGGAHASILVADPWMSSVHARLLRAETGDWRLVDVGSKNGTFIHGQRTAGSLLREGDVIEVGHTFFIFSELDAPPAAEAEPPVPELATMVPELAARFAEMARVASSTAPILLQGETGTGKEVVARAIHALSGRHGAFVAVNCGGLPDHLVESELFGYRRGAFSGAVEDRAGLVRSAHRGTLLFDELGDLRPQAQAAVLRVLQEREVHPLGAPAPVPVDFRLVGATHRDLSARVAEGGFREDLYARVAGLTVWLPPLRERRQDLGLLLGGLLRRHGGEAAPSLSPEAMRAILRHEWPRNIRELERAIEVAVPLAAAGPIELAHLPPSLRSGGPELALELNEDDSRRKTELEALLGEHGGNVSAVARALGKDRTQVHRWLRRFGIALDGFRR